MSAPLIGDLSLELPDGRVLKATTDITLAELWAQEVMGQEWDTMPQTARWAAIGQALAELRRLAGN